MAALTSSNVRLVKAWVEGEIYAKRRKVLMVEVHGGSWGGTSNTMPATAFGLTCVEEASLGRYEGGAVAIAPVPNAAGDTVYLHTAVDGSQAAADLSVAATPNGLYFTVKGY